ncbi:methionine synthase [Ornithinimicrobium humiphilum]|uniref:Cobalamin-independent methionine synthase catalytic subunit n=1 Tax=Ornithinimicrobium humiphilum TaxID=125288 RepID=A0A543KLQ3_9MICO|nr:methionine synthase [Ornithinimicrobium humiphilum]TQM96015.1 cobalamin-independent methionine synthase catalytic subunit [Ornithinimicrobium humiphilum]
MPDPNPTSSEPARPTGSTVDPRVVATGVGSWPGTDVREALRVVRGELADPAPEGVTGLPYLPELPARGPGSDLVGRSAGLLVDLPVDLQPQGWRLVDRPGRDAERTAAWWRQDLDELAEAFDGWTGPLKLQVGGPWTLAASLWLPLGDRVLSDPGATRDLTASIAEGVAGHVAAVRRLVPGADVVVQVDEPSLTAVSLGRIRSESGYRVLRTPSTGELVTSMASVVDAARGAGAVQVAVHSCAPDVPLHLLRQTGADAVALDVALLSTAGWERVAELLDAGVAVWAGLLPTDGDPQPGPRVDAFVRRWRELGLPVRDLTGVTVTPACGLAGAAPEGARALTAGTVTAAARLADVALA